MPNRVRLEFVVAAREREASVRSDAGRPRRRMLLTQPAIALLERLPEVWTDLDHLGLRGYEPALLELKREGCAETEVWPPPDPRRRRYYRSAGRAIDDEVRRVTRVRRTGRGTLRLARLREARRR